jgi:uncharacterized iron-regulated protein
MAVPHHPIPSRDRRGVRRLVAILALASLTACAQPPGEPLRFTRPVVLLGEVHDNAGQHRLRLRAFEDWLATGARPALVMEQFDSDRQAAIDALRVRSPPPDADALVAEAGGPGWQWDFYRPFVALALRHDLPIVAANVSREGARRVMRDGLAASGFDAAVPPDILDTIAQQVEAGHCGTLDAPTARRMALAQVARDQAMARAVEAHAGRGVLLLAGNGHVRTDVGVPRWLTPATRVRSEAIGLLEVPATGEGSFDRVVTTPAATRSDPCAAMRR